MSKINNELDKLAKRWITLVDEIAKHQEDLKQLKAEIKNVGFDTKVLGQVVKELRKDENYRADQLEMELMLDTYREAVGLPRAFEEAQALVRDAANAIPTNAGEVRS